MINLHYTLRRLVGQPTCVKPRTTRLLSSARIFNIGGPSERIRLGEYCTIRGELLVFPHGGRITVGDWSYIGEGTRIWSGAEIAIGNRVMIAHNVNIFDNQTHPLDPAARHAHYRHIYEKGHPADIELGDRPVEIEDDAWIGAGATILRGVCIGRGAIIGAGSVVSEDVPSMTIAKGNPACVVQRISASGSGEDHARPSQINRNRAENS